VQIRLKEISHELTTRWRETEPAFVFAYVASEAAIEWYWSPHKDVQI